MPENTHRLEPKVIALTAVRGLFQPLVPVNVLDAPRDDSLTMNEHRVRTAVPEELQPATHLSVVHVEMDIVQLVVLPYVQNVPLGSTALLILQVVMCVPTVPILQIFRRAARLVSRGNTVT